jgi:hypothetical protein
VASRRQHFRKSFLSRLPSSSCLSCLCCFSAHYSFSLPSLGARCVYPEPFNSNLQTLLMRLARSPRLLLHRRKTFISDDDRHTRTSPALRRYLSPRESPRSRMQMMFQFARRSEVSFHCQSVERLGVRLSVDRTRPGWDGLLDVELMRK